MSTATLSLRQLNRATLARQLLLERAKCTPLQAIEKLAGLQAPTDDPWGFPKTTEFAHGSEYLGVGIDLARDDARELLTFRDEQGRELFDLPKAPRPPADTPAPVRFLPGFDNLVLVHADRKRIIADEHRPKICTKNLRVHPTFLVDGFAAGLWKIEATKTRTTTADNTEYCAGAIPTQPSARSLARLVRTRPRSPSRVAQDRTGSSTMPKWVGIAPAQYPDRIDMSELFFKPGHDPIR